MKEEINQFTIIRAGNKVIGFGDKRSLKEYLNEIRIEKMLQYCEAEGMDFEEISPKKLRAILNEINDINEEDKIYKTNIIVEAIENSDLEEDIKSELIELLLEYNAEFYVDEYDGLYEILIGIDDVEI